MLETLDYTILIRIGSTPTFYISIWIHAYFDITPNFIISILISTPAYAGNFSFLLYL